MATNIGRFSLWSTAAIVIIVVAAVILALTR